MKITTFNKLKKYESYLYSAKHLDCMRGLTNTQMEELLEIGKEIDIIGVNNHCPKCALNFVKRLATPYFEQKQKNEENANKRQKKTEGGSEETSNS